MRDINIHFDQHQQMMSKEDEVEKEVYLNVLRNLIADGNSLFSLNDNMIRPIWFDDENNLQAPIKGPSES